MNSDLANSTKGIFQKPDAIDTTIHDTPVYDTQVYDTPIAEKSIFQKPHAYDEDPPVVITASRHGSRNSKITVDRHGSKSSRMTAESFSSRYFQRIENVAPSVIQTKDTGYYNSPNTPTQMISPPLSPKRSCSPHLITSYILSQPTPTTQTTFGHHCEEPHETPISPANSVTSNTTIHQKSIVATTTAALLTNNDSGTESSFYLNQQKRQGNTTKKQNNNMINYNIKKASLLKPNQHYIYLHIDHLDEDGESEDLLMYRKVQPFSYKWWGFQSMLYCNKNDGQGVKIAEARRKAFGAKEIYIETADYEQGEISDVTQPHIANLKNSPASSNIHCQELIKKSQSNILFEYEIWFNGSRMRWKRPSLLSHDFTCEIKLTRQETKLLLQKKNSTSSQYSGKNLLKKNKPKKKKNMLIRGESGGFIDSDSDNDEDDHDNHTHKSCRRWKLIAMFDSQNMSYLSRDYGKLSIDLDILNQVERDRCDLLEAHIVMTCSTLIDLMRDVMGK